MLPELLQKVSLFHLLYRIDKDFLKNLQKAECPYCCGPLHQSNYERKPRGGPKNIPDKYMVRFSLCCGHEACRRRTMPLSCRFMGRRVYWSCVILVVMTLRQNRPDNTGTGKLRQMFNISRKTLNRWFEYFRDEFPSSSRWQYLRGRVSSSIDNQQLPGQLMNYFLKQTQAPFDGIIRCLKFLAGGERLAFQI